MKLVRCSIGRASWLILRVDALSNGLTLGLTRISPTPQRPQCGASRITSGKIVEARRCCGGCVSRCAVDQDASRSGALDGGLPSAPTSRRGGPDHNAGSEALGSDRLRAAGLEAGRVARSVVLQAISRHSPTAGGPVNRATVRLGLGVCSRVLQSGFWHAVDPLSQAMRAVHIW
jgi:hypothetical protein